MQKQCATGAVHYNYTDRQRLAEFAMFVKQTRGCRQGSHHRLNDLEDGDKTTRDGSSSNTIVQTRMVDWQHAMMVLREGSLGCMLQHKRH